MSGFKLLAISSAMFTVSIKLVAPVNQNLHVEKVENHEVPTHKVTPIYLIVERVHSKFVKMLPFSYRS